MAVYLIQIQKRCLWTLTGPKSSIVEVVGFLPPVFLLSTLTITYHFIITQAFTTTNPLPLVFTNFKSHLYSLLINFIFTVASDHAEWSKPESQTRVVASSVLPFLTRGLPHVCTWILMLFHQRPFLLNPLQAGTLKSFCEGLSK